MLEMENNYFEQRISVQETVEQFTVNPAPLFKRLLAYLIDLIILISTSAYLYNIIIDVSLYTFFVDQDIFIWSTISAIVFYQFYFFILEYIWNGKTVGKYLLNISVVTKKGTRVKLSGSLIRNFFRIINFLPPLFFIPDLVCIFISKEHKSIADLLSGSVVINTKIN